MVAVKQAPPLILRDRHAHVEALDAGPERRLRRGIKRHSSLATTATYVSHIAPAKAVAEATANTAHLSVQP